VIKAKYTDKNLIVNILASSFDKNKSVNYIIKQDGKRAQRIKRLMEYSFEMCYSFGDVYLSDDKKACALILLPDKKKTNFKSVLLDVKLIITCVGLSKLFKVLNRESKIKEFQTKGLMYYLWFIGVDPNEQNKGIGSALIQEIITEGRSMQRPVCLETSTLKNIPWYEKFGFQIYNELDLGYPLFFMKKE
jgi:predicted N-acetyltransferase YhbS